jgi:hypothetical protein
MFADEIVADGDLLAHTELGKNDWLTIEPAEHDLLVIIAGIYGNPHPFRFTARVVRELHLYVVALGIFAHAAFFPCPSDGYPRRMVSKSSGEISDAGTSL